jgi:rhamnogalacturonyl hydrolase YesR
MSFKTLFALLSLVLATSASAAAASATAASAADFALPARADVLKKMRAVNDYFMAEWPDVGKPIVTNRSRPSNIWTRGVYYEGLMEFWRLERDPRLLDYAVRWGDAHKWSLRNFRHPNGGTTHNADDQCAGQIYIELWQVDPRPERIRDIKANIDAMLERPQNTDWWWIDALQMAMPVYAKLGAIATGWEGAEAGQKYFEKMHALYLNTKNEQGGGLFNTAEGLWWRDASFVPPYKTPNGKNCYWSRGNGWVVVALTRTLDSLPDTPATAAYRAEYTAMLKTMCEALRKIQRDDGFWNASLADPGHFGGKETTGTSLFTAGMAWGVRHGVLDRATYGPVIARAWAAMANEAVHANGFLGYVQGTGKEPKDGQPVTHDSKPDFEDYGAGCFLIAGAELCKLTAK